MLREALNKNRGGTLEAAIRRGRVKIEERRDRSLRYNAAALVVLGVLSMILMGVDLVVTYDFDAGHFEHTNPPSSEVLKFAMTACCILIQFPLWFFYSAKYRAKSRGFWTHGHGRFLYVLEAVILLFHPFPYLVESANNKLSLLMIMRIYLVGRTVHYWVPYYRLRNRYQIQVEGLDDRMELEVHQGAAIKALWENHTGLFALVLGVVMFFLTAYIQYVLEREQEVGEFTWTETLWFTFVTMTTIGYGDITPKSGLGRLATVCMGLTGLVLTSLLIGVVTNALVLSSHQRATLSLMQEERISERVSKAAARLILHRWRLIQMRKAHKQAVRGMRREAREHADELQAYAEAKWRKRQRDVSGRFQNARETLSVHKRDTRSEIDPVHLNTYEILKIVQRSASREVELAKRIVRIERRLAEQAGEDESDVSSLASDLLLDNFDALDAFNIRRIDSSQESSSFGSSNSSLAISNTDATTASTSETSASGSSSADSSASSSEATSSSS